MADLARLRTVFMGTPLFAVPCLKKLHAVSDVAAVVTQPDRPRGRGQRMTPSPVKAYAIEQGLPVFQPVKVRETAFLETLRKIQPDLIVVVAFGQILPPAILALPKQGCINVHASLLPRYRGAAPMQRCLMAGEKTTGVTTMFMDAGLDTGDMLQKTEIPIGPDMTLAELHDALMVRGADLLGTTLEALMVGTLRRETQDDAMANYAPMITKEDASIGQSQRLKFIIWCGPWIRGRAPTPFLRGNPIKFGERTWRTGRHILLPARLSRLRGRGFSWERAKVAWRLWRFRHRGKNG